MTHDAPLTRNTALYWALGLGLVSCLIATLLGGLFGLDRVESRLGQVACFIGMIFGTCGGFVLLSECTEQHWLKLRVVQLIGRNLHAVLSIVSAIGAAVFGVIFAISPAVLIYVALLPGTALVTITFLEAHAGRSLE